MNEDQYKIVARRVPDKGVKLFVVAKQSGAMMTSLTLPLDATPDDVKTAANTLMELWMAGLRPGYASAPGQPFVGVPYANDL